MKHLILSASLLLSCTSANAADCINPTKTYSGIALTKALTCLQSRVKTVLNATKSKGVVIFENDDIRLYSVGVYKSGSFYDIAFIIKNKSAIATKFLINDSSIFAVDTANYSCSSIYEVGLSYMTVLPGAEMPFRMSVDCSLTWPIDLQFVLQSQESGGTGYLALPIYLSNIPLPQ